MLFTICYWHLKRFHQSQDRRNKSLGTEHNAIKRGISNGLHASNGAAASHSSGDRTEIANPDGERQKGMGCGACETFRETGGKQEDDTK